jgi:hypothetical protein
MLKLSLGILLIVCLFDPSISKYSDAYSANNESCILYKIIESFTNNNCSGPEVFTLTYSPNIFKNSIIPKTLPKKENWNEYIVLSGSNFPNNIKSIKITEKIDSSQLIIYELILGFSAFLLTIVFFISIVE